MPNQTIDLMRRPIFVHPTENDKAVFPRPELFQDIKVIVLRGGVKLPVSRTYMKPLREAGLFTRFS